MNVVKILREDTADERDVGRREKEMKAEKVYERREHKQKWRDAGHSGE